MYYANELTRFKLLVKHFITEFNSSVDDVLNQDFQDLMEIMTTTEDDYYDDPKEALELYK